MKIISNEIMELTMQLGLTSMRYQTEIANFAKAQGDEACIKALLYAQKQREWQTEQGGVVPSAMMLFNKARESHIRDIKQRENDEKISAETRKERAGYERAIEKGWCPTKQNIKEMLDDQYKRGEIDYKSYQYGLKGLPFVHDMIKEGQEAEDKAEKAKDQKAEKENIRLDFGDVPF